MNKIVRFGLIVVVASLIGACCNTVPVVNCGSSQDTFRITMKSGDQGSDVTHWQCFLLEKGFGHAAPNGTFNQETVDATTRFQKSSCYGGNQSILPTGTVTYATYWKAVRAGMPKYKVTISSQPSRSHRHLTGRGAAIQGNVQIRDIGNGEAFFTPMKLGCKDKLNDPEVTDWQNILSCLGYTPGNPGSYDIATQTATGNFQTDFNLLGVNGVNMGIVDSAHTFATAKLNCPCPVNVTIHNGTACSN